LHIEGLHDLYASLNIIRVSKSRIRWVGHVAHTGEKRNSYRILVGKPEGNRPLGTSKHIFIPHFTWGLGSKTPTKSENPQIDYPHHPKTIF
jgi:hypothetical protein